MSKPNPFDSAKSMEFFKHIQSSLSGENNGSLPALQPRGGQSTSQSGVYVSSNFFSDDDDEALVSKPAVKSEAGNSRSNEKPKKVRRVIDDDDDDDDNMIRMKAPVKIERSQCKAEPVFREVDHISPHSSKHVVMTDITDSDDDDGGEEYTGGRDNGVDEDVVCLTQSMTSVALGPDKKNNHKYEYQPQHRHTDTSSDEEEGLVAHSLKPTLLPTQSKPQSKPQTQDTQKTHVQSKLLPTPAPASSTSSSMFGGSINSGVSLFGSVGSFGAFNIESGPKVDLVSKLIDRTHTKRPNHTDKPSSSVTSVPTPASVQDTVSESVDKDCESKPPPHVVAEYNRWLRAAKRIEKAMKAKQDLRSAEEEDAEDDDALFGETPRRGLCSLSDMVLLPSALRYYSRALMLHSTADVRKKVERLKRLCEEQGVQSSVYALEVLDGYHTHVDINLWREGDAATTAIYGYKGCLSTALNHELQVTQSEGEPVLVPLSTANPAKINKAINNLRLNYKCVICRNVVTNNIHIVRVEDQAFSELFSKQLLVHFKQDPFAAFDRKTAQFKKDTSLSSSKLSEKLCEVFMECVKHLSEKNYPTSLMNVYTTSDIHQLLVNNSLIVPHETYQSIYSYQRECLCWLWSVHHSKHKGGILGDDMGLGKTVQLCTFIRSLFHSKHGKRVLLISPVSVLPQWENEARKWCGDVRIETVHSQSDKKRIEAVSRIVQKGGILLTTYGMLTNNVRMLSLNPELADIEGVDEDNDKKKKKKSEDKLQDDYQALLMCNKKWDYIIMDEGHKLKNPEIELSKAARKVMASHRILLTGTPVQNNLDEVWSLFDFACNGQLLGNRRIFNSEFAKFINDGQIKDVSDRDRSLAVRAASALRDLIKPYFLRREKTGIQNSGDTSNVNSTDPLSALVSGVNINEKTHENEEEVQDDDHANSQQHSHTPYFGSLKYNNAATAADSSSHNVFSLSDLAVSDANMETSSSNSQRNEVKLPSLDGIQKNELILWVYLSPIQRQIYRSFISDENIKALLNSSSSPLAALTILKKICDHPRLLQGDATDKMDIEDADATNDMENAFEDDDDDTASKQKNTKKKGMKMTTEAIQQALKQYISVGVDDEDERQYDSEFLAFKHSYKYSRITGNSISEISSSSSSSASVSVSASASEHEHHHGKKKHGFQGFNQTNAFFQTSNPVRPTVYNDDIKEENINTLVSTNLPLSQSLSSNLPKTFSNISQWSSSAVDVIMESGKLRVLIELLHILRRDGHRPIIFSQSKRMLDIIQLIISSPPLSMTFLRVDGDVTNPHERQRRINEFNNDPNIFCFLLTTRAGGVGINLTGADRVIIFDPDWNPAVDAQAVDRSYRLGQRHNVVVYRLVTCGTVEEVIYRKQVFKNALINVTLKNSQRAQTRYFSKKDLTEVLSLISPLFSQTQHDLIEQHPPENRNTYPELENHISELCNGNMFTISLAKSEKAERAKARVKSEDNHQTVIDYTPLKSILFGFRIFGISDHDLLFSGHGDHVEDDKAVDDVVSKAKDRLLSTKVDRYESKVDAYIKRQQKNLEKDIKKKMKGFAGNVGSTSKYKQINNDNVKMYEPTTHGLSRDHANESMDNSHIKKKTLLYSSDDDDVHEEIVDADGEISGNEDSEEKRIARAEAELLLLKKRRLDSDSDDDMTDAQVIQKRLDKLNKTREEIMDLNDTFNDTIKENKKMNITLNDKLKEHKNTGKTSKEDKNSGDKYRNDSVSKTSSINHNNNNNDFSQQLTSDDSDRVLNFNRHSNKNKNKMFDSDSEGEGDVVEVNSKRRVIDDDDDDDDDILVPRKLSMNPTDINNNDVDEQVNTGDSSHVFDNDSDFEIVEHTSQHDVIALDDDDDNNDSSIGAIISLDCDEDMTQPDDDDVILVSHHSSTQHLNTTSGEANLNPLNTSLEKLLNHPLVTKSKQRVSLSRIDQSLNAVFELLQENNNQISLQEIDNMTSEQLYLLLLRNCIANFNDVYSFVKTHSSDYLTSDTFQNKIGTLVTCIQYAATFTVHIIDSDDGENNDTLILANMVEALQDLLT